jgi:hypothetical protein
MIVDGYCSVGAELNQHKINHICDCFSVEFSRFWVYGKSLMAAAEFEWPGRDHERSNVQRWLIVMIAGSSRRIGRGVMEL